MLANFLGKIGSFGSGRSRKWLLVVLPLWVLIGFTLAQALLLALLVLLGHFGVSFVGTDEVILNAVFAAAVYVFSLGIVVGLPLLFKRGRVSKQEFGLQRLPSWLDLGLAPAGFVVYMISSVLLVAAATALVPSINLEQVQETGFENIGHRYEYLIAFVTLVVVAPLAEEILFRGYLYGKLRKLAVPVWIVILVVSLLFAAVHGQWNVALDVFALSIVLCVLREMTGSIWAGILLHMIKNSVAFYFLFINPDILRTIGG
jgi:membrane protease YdiL (CAAX protease family)